MNLHWALRRTSAGGRRDPSPHGDTARSTLRSAINHTRRMRPLRGGSARSLVGRGHPSPHRDPSKSTPRSATRHPRRVRPLRGGGGGGGTRGFVGRRHPAPHQGTARSQTRKSVPAVPANDRRRALVGTVALGSAAETAGPLAAKSRSVRGREAIKTAADEVRRDWTAWRTSCAPLPPPSPARKRLLPPLRVSTRSTRREYRPSAPGLVPPAYFGQARSGFLLWRFGKYFS